MMLFEADVNTYLNDNPDVLSELEKVITLGWPSPVHINKESVSIEDFTV